MRQGDGDIWRPGQVASFRSSSSRHPERHGYGMYFSLSYDYRIIEGATAVRFLQAVKANLEDIVACLLTRDAN